MNEQNPNFHMIRLVATSLGSLNDELVYVGGCAIGLLITDNARPAVRTTNDVDLIAEVTSLTEYYKLCQRLKNANLSEQIGNINCRWRSQNGILIDVMPTNEKILGYSNRWFLPAIQNSSILQLSETLTIKLASAPLLVASKIEAFYGRGNGDYRSSHDIEDIINLVDGRPELIEEVSLAPDDVRRYLTTELDDLLGQQAFTSSIPFHFNPDEENQARIPMVMQRLRHIAGL